MSDKWLAAAFYLPRGHRKADLHDLVRAAGAVELPPLSPDSPRGGVDTEWAEMFGWAYLDELAEHNVLTIRFRQSNYLELLDVEPDRHPIAQAFRHACLMLRPDVAFVVAHLHQSETEYLLSFEVFVICRDADVLLREHFGLLYMNEAVAARRGCSERDTLPVPDGDLLIFSGSGRDRWF
jgi:hypothetical protein